jgi:hypothetical protein
MRTRLRDRQEIRLDATPITHTFGFPVHLRKGSFTMCYLLGFTCRSIEVTLKREHGQRARRDFNGTNIGQADRTSPHKACENYISHAHTMRNHCYLKVGEQYGKPTLSLPFGGLQNKCGACAGLTPDQPARHIEETTMIKGREFPLRLRNDERTVDRGAWGTHSAPGVRHPEEKPA